MKDGKGFRLAKLRPIGWRLVKFLPEGFMVLEAIDMMPRLCTTLPNVSRKRFSHAKPRVTSLSMELGELGTGFRLGGRVLRHLSRY